jgi:hypothetical protein
MMLIVLALSVSVQCKAMRLEAIKQNLYVIFMAQDNLAEFISEKKFRSPDISP